MHMRWWTAHMCASRLEYKCFTFNPIPKSKDNGMGMRLSLYVRYFQSKIQARGFLYVRLKHKPLPHHRRSSLRHHHPTVKSSAGTAAIIIQFLCVYLYTSHNVMGIPNTYDRKRIYVYGFFWLKIKKRR